MSGPVRTRLACDRCHSQKLRCPKQPGSAICTRCMRAGASCVYSPPGTNTGFLNGNGNSVGTMGSVMMVDGISGGNDSSAEAFDWGTYVAMDFNTLLEQPAPNDVQAACQEGYTNPAAAPIGAITPAPSDGPSDDNDSPRVACTKRLTDLLLDTDKLWAKLPQLSTSHIPRSDPHELYIKALTEKATTKYILENIFTIAQQLIDLYAPAEPLIFSRGAGPAAPCHIPDCTHELELPAALRPLEEAGPRTPSVDAALANVLVACHVRLLDVLDRVFLLVTSCTRVTLASPERREPEFSLTDMRVGSFVPHRAAAVLMHMALLRHLMASLSDKLALLGGAIASRGAGGAAGRDVGEEEDDDDLDVRVLRLQHESLSRRHARQVQHVATIEEFLSGWDFNKT